MTTQITQTTINTVVPANAGLNLITLSADNSPVSLVYPSTFIQSPNYLAAGIVVNKVEGYTGGVIKMPNAFIITQSIVCQIYNQSSTSITVTSFTDEEIVVINPGISIVFFLLPQEIPTAGGQWLTFQLGAGTSEANAAALAGYGLIALDNKLNSFILTIDENSSIPLTNNFDAKLINWIGGNYTLNLDSLVDGMNGFYFLIKNSSPSNGILTISATSIDNGTSIDLLLNQSCILIRNNDNNTWKTVGLGNFSFGNAIKFTSTGIQLINGTASQPSLAYIDQPTTGLFSNGTGDVSFTNSGIETLNIESTGIKLLRGNYLLGDNLVFEIAKIYP